MRELKFLRELFLQGRCTITNFDLKLFYDIAEIFPLSYHVANSSAG